MTDETWQHAVLGLMERLIGAEQTAKLATEWNEHATRDKVEITFLGPYSSGKSTLLRRLVVDGVWMSDPHNPPTDGSPDSSVLVPPSADTPIITVVPSERRATVS